MKKTTLLMCLLYSVPNSAMGSRIAAARAAAVAGIATPVVGPGAYYYYKTQREYNQELKRLEKDPELTKTVMVPIGDGEAEPVSIWTDKGELQVRRAQYATELYAPYKLGVSRGVWPVVNMLELVECFFSFRECNSDKEKAFNKGLLSGASVYATAPLALMLLKKVK